MIYGFNDTTIPPVNVLPYSLHHSRSIGRPTIILSFEMIELMRTSGWTEVANALETSRTTVWRRLRDAGYQILKYTDISDEQLANVFDNLTRTIS